MQNTYEPIVVMLGAEKVGKTECLARLRGLPFSGHYSSTICIDPHSDKDLKITYYDISGKKEAKDAVFSFVKNAHFAILVFDITNLDSFNNLKSDILLCDTNKLNKSIIIGNKSDLSNERKVSQEEAMKFAEEHGMTYFETSAKSDNDFHHIRTYIADMILPQKVEDHSFKDSVPETTDNSCYNFFLNVLCNIANTLALLICYLFRACVSIGSCFQENKEVRHDSDDPNNIIRL